MAENIPSSSLTPSAALFTYPNISQAVYVKLDGPNYLRWLTQILPMLRSTELLGIVDGSLPCPRQYTPDTSGKDTSVVNPEYSLWTRKDQYLLSVINATLAERVLSTVFGMDSSRQVWTHLANKFANQSPSRIAHLKRQLQSLHQGSNSCSDFLYSAKLWADQLAAVGKPLADDDLISYVISGLNHIYAPFVTTLSFVNQNSTISFDDFQSELLSHEIFLNHQHHLVPPTSSPLGMFANSLMSTTTTGNRRARLT